LVLCRNVTIYFQAEIVRRIIKSFRQSLVEGGWLIVGHSEPNLQFFDDFRTIDAPGAILYQKATAVASSATSPLPAAPAASPGLQLPGCEPPVASYLQKGCQAA